METFNLVTEAAGLYSTGNEELLKVLGVYNIIHLVERYY